jgi:hypothetical protein
MNKLISSVVLLEGITHIEDLPLSEFIRTVESLKDKIVTEKLDGSNLWFGVDEGGMYTSREGKSKKSNRCYNVNDYPMVANYNGFRAAHLALEGVESTILKHFSNGDQAEIEVLFGRQPNTVTYGVQDKSFIVILRPVGTTTQETVDALAKDLNKKQVKVRSKIVYSEDGDKLMTADTDMVWEFTNVEPIDSKKVDISDAMVLLKQMQKFMAQKNKVLTNLTNEEVAELSLNKIPKEERDAAKAERDRINDFFLKTFKEPIKEHLLGKFVRKIKPFLQADELDPSEDIGVEGVVVRDPVTGSQTKIVDKDVFTAVNTFNSAIRNHIAGLVRTDKQDAPIELRGGAYGQAKIRIADLLGAKELALSSGAKRFLTKFKAENASLTAVAVAKSLNIDDLEGTKTKIAAILKATSREIQKILEKFKSEASDFKLKLKTGKEIGISPEVMRRTLTAFAETKQDISDVASRVQRAKSPADLVLALYGRTIESIFVGEESSVSESLSLLKSIAMREDDGAVDAASTVAASTAPTEQRLFHGNKTISRRPRKFVKVKKFPAPEQQKADDKMNTGIPESKTAFSLMKAVTESWAHLSDMKYATNVDDSAVAQNDVEFKQMRNDVNIGADITSSNVDQYLDKAHELNDEVDTVTFGMDMDDGQVVKVYVAATDADGFEHALSELLGSEDDVEKVINNLADEYDIVDVEWPEGYQADTVGDDTSVPVDGDTEAGDIDLNGDGIIDFSVDSEDEDNFDLEVPSDEEGGDGEISTDSGDVDSGETIDQEVSSDSEGEAEAEAGSEDSTEGEGGDGDGDEPTPSDSEAEEGSTDGDTDGDTEGSTDEVTDGVPADDEETEDETDDEAGEDGDDEAGFLDTIAGQTSKKKKKTDDESAEEEPKVAEESAMTKSLGELFKDRLLAEARVKAEAEAEDPAVVAAREKHESALKDLLEAFPARQSRAIITLMISLGVPIKPLMSRRAVLRKNIADASDLYMKSASFRMWIKKFLTALNDASVTEAADIDKKLNNKFQHVTWAIIQKLGLPDEIVTVSQRQLIAGIRSVAKVAMGNPDVRIYLMSVAKELGVEDVGRGLPETEGDAVNEAALLETVQDAEALVIELLTTLGFDTTANRSIQSQMKLQAARAALTRVAANSTLLAKMGGLNQLLDKQIP